VSILVAGIGNVFLGDDGFGVEVVRRLAQMSLPEWLRVVDFGIRGYDLAYALLDPAHEAAILVDLVSRGGAVGTLSVIEPQVDPGAPCELDAHAMHPERVLSLAHALGGVPVPVRIVGCEGLAADDDMTDGLSPPVEAAVEAAAVLVLEVARALHLEARHA
jgi:hydrogenase maturation protease